MHISRTQSHTLAKETPSPVIIRVFIVKINKSIYLMYIFVHWNHNIYIYIYIYIVIHRQIRLALSELISVASHSWDRNPVDSNAKQKPLTIQPRGAISCEVNLKQL